MGTKGQYVTIDLIKEEAREILDFENILNNYKIANIVFNTISKLGDPSLLITRITDGKNGPNPIDIINYRGLLPLDMVEIISGTVRNYDTKVKLIPTNNPFFLSDIDETLETYSDEASVGESVSQDDEGTITTSDYYSPLMSSLNTQPVVDKYMIQNGEIITSMEEGQLEFSYKAFPLDNNGFPKIPDEPKLIELIKWAILERAAIKLWTLGKIRRDIYDHIESKYLFYKKSASNQLKVNSIPELEAFKNRFLRLHQDINQYGNDFIDWGYPEDFTKHSF